MMRWLQNDARFSALAGALLLYGALGSPTPDQPGWIEALIGFLLAVSVTFPRSGPRSAFLPLLVIGLTIPLGIAAFNGRAFEDIARDIIPFLFLCLPFFILPEERAREFLALCLLVGVLFAARVLGQGLDIFPAQTELLYLANSPLVVMSAIIGMGVAGIDVYRRMISLRSIIFLCGGLICLLAMLVDVQRATIMAVVFSLILLAIIGFIHAPRRMLWPCVIAGVAMLASYDIVYTAWQSMAIKTALVGVNARWLEVMAVYDHLRGNWWRVLFGIGWGGHFDSPAVGGWSVPYTHSLITYMLLKTGMTGLVATIGALLVCLLPVFANRVLLSLALFWAILIPTFFYASYKSLDFGLVLVLALLLPRAMGLLKDKI